MIARTARWVDARLGLSRFARTTLRKVFPDHWSFLLGELALYSFVVLVVTGVFLTFFFDPSSAKTTYHGTYVPLQGVEMSRAYASVVHLSFEVRAGLVMRQLHHWAALVFLAAIVAHLCRNFFTGSFRRPRELNWMIGVALLILAIVNGFAGYSLPDDLLSGTGLRVGYSIALSIPIVGTWLAFLVFGGAFPADATISRLYGIHILLVPAAIAALLGAHLAILWRQKHTQFPGPGRTEGNVVGTHLWPTYAAKSVGLFALVTGVLAGLGGLFQINPVWLYGPYDPAAVSTAAQPDWYFGWIEGAIRLAGPWRVHLFGFTISELFWPAVVLPTITFGLLFLWPFIEARVTGDYRTHHVLDRPRDRPARTAIGVGVLAFYAMLFVAGSQDIIAQKLQFDIVTIIWWERVLTIVVPLVSAAFAWKLARDLHRGSRMRAQEVGAPEFDRPEQTAMTTGSTSPPPGW